MAGKIFGIDLQTLVQQQNAEVPKLVTHIVEFLTSREAYLEEGLFRIPGNTVKISELKKIIDKDGKVDLYKHKDVDSHTAGGVLKLFLRELPVPIIIPRYYSTVLKVYANQDARQRMVHTRKLILGLPKCNRDLLIEVAKFLHKVAEHELVNKMSSLNLAVIFAPNLIRTENENLMQIMEDSTKVAGAIQLIIQEVEYIEKGIEPQWFNQEGFDLTRNKSGSLILPSPRGEVSQGSPPSTSSAISSTNTSLNNSMMDISSPVSVACHEDGASDLPTNCTSSDTSAVVIMSDVAETNANENTETPYHEVPSTKSEPSRSPRKYDGDEVSPRKHDEGHTPPEPTRSTPPAMSPIQLSPTSAPPSIIVDAPRTTPRSTTPRGSIPNAPQYSTTNGEISPGKTQEITPAAIHPHPSPHFDAAHGPNIVISADHNESSHAKPALPNMVPTAEPAEPATVKKSKSRLRKATLGLFSPLRKGTHKSSHAQSIPGEEVDSATGQNGGHVRPGDESDDNDGEAEESELPSEIHEHQGENNGRSQTPITEITRTGGTLIPRTDSSPLIKPRSPPERGGTEREKLTLSDSPEFTRKQKSGGSTLSDSAELVKSNSEPQVRRRSESDTSGTPPAIIEKGTDDKSHARHRSNTFLSKIGAMSFRKSTFVRNGSENSLAAFGIPTSSASSASSSNTTNEAGSTAGLAEDVKVSSGNPEKPSFYGSPPEKLEHSDAQERNGDKHKKDLSEKAEKSEKLETIEEKNEETETHEKIEKIEKHEKGEKHDEHEKSENPDTPEKNEKSEKNEKNEKFEKNEKTEKFEKSEKNEKFEKNEKNEKFEKNEKNEKFEKNEKPDKRKKNEKQAKKDKSEKVEKQEKHEKNGKHEKPEKHKADKNAKHEKSEKIEKSEKNEKNGKHKNEKNEKHDKNEKREKGEKHEKLEKTEKHEKSEKHKKSDKTEKNESDSKLDARARVDVRIDDTLDG